MRVRRSSICRGGHSKALNTSSLSEGRSYESETLFLFAEEDTVKHWTRPLLSEGQVIWEWDALLFAEEDTVKHWTPSSLVWRPGHMRVRCSSICRGGHSKALNHVLSVWRPGHMRVRRSSICCGGHSKALNTSSLSEGQVIWEWDALLFAVEDTVKHWTRPLCLKARSYESEMLFYLPRRTQ